MSAHSASQRGGVFAALVTQVSEYLLEPVDQTVDVEPVELAPQPVIAVVSAAPKSGASTVARLLAAELAMRADGAALVARAPGTTPAHGAAPPARAAARLATALRGAAGPAARASGRLCVAGPVRLDHLLGAARYLAPAVLDLAPDGSASEAARMADHVVVVAGASQEPALLAAVAAVLGGDVVRVVNRFGAAAPAAGADGPSWDCADLRIPDARLAARAASMGARAPGPLGDAIADLADALGCTR